VVVVVVVFDFLLANSLKKHKNKVHHEIH